MTDLAARISHATNTTVEQARAWIAQDSRLVMTPTEAFMREEMYTNDYAVVALNERGVITYEEYTELFR